jgi:Concanavalin A-like lectin/glucanases superfamily
MAVVEYPFRRGFDRPKAAWKCALPTLMFALLGCGSDAHPGADADAGEARPDAGIGLDYALSFDGVDDYATLGIVQFPAAVNAQTISLWFAPTSVTGRQSLIVLRKDTESGFEIGFVDGALAAWRVFGDRVVFDKASRDPSLLLKPGEWHHLAYVYDGDQGLLYLDGALFDSAMFDPGHRTPTSGWLGTKNGFQHLYQGRLDELRIWKVVRSAEQIALDFKGSVSNAEPGLVGYYPFDESGGMRAFDYSEFGNDVVLGDGVAETAPKRVLSTSPVARK